MSKSCNLCPYTTKISIWKCFNIEKNTSVGMSEN